MVVITHQNLNWVRFSYPQILYHLSQSRLRFQPQSHQFARATHFKLHSFLQVAHSINQGHWANHRQLEQIASGPYFSSLVPSQTSLRKN